MSIRKHGWVAIAVSALIMSGCVPAEQSTQPADAAEASSTLEVAQTDVRVISVEDSTDSQQNVHALELFNRLTEEVQQLRGKVEVLEFELEQTRARQRQLYDDLDRRIRQFERQFHGDVEQKQPEPEIAISLDSEPVESNEQQPADETVAAETVADETAEAEAAAEVPAIEVDPAVVRGVYDSAFQALREGRYEDAIAMFGSLVSSYPGSDLVDDSMYWIAEANYVTKNLEAALPAFERVIREFPDSQRAPEAMLKIGYIYYDREQFDSARDYLQEVVDKFPASRSAFSARRRLNKMEREQGE